MIDAGRMAALVSRPGIDPRVNVTIGTVKDVAYDAAHGMFADVNIVPTGDLVNCMVGVEYAGNHYGSWAKLKVDDVVLVAIINGDRAQGGVVIARLYRESDLPPTELSAEENPSETVTDATDNVVLRVEPGKKYILRTSGAGGAVDVKVEGDGELNIEQAGTGNVYITVAGGSNKVYVGDRDGTQPLSLGQTLQNHLDATKSYTDAHTHLAGLLVAPPSGGPVTGTTGAPVGAAPNVPDVRATKVNGV